MLPKNSHSLPVLQVASMLHYLASKIMKLDCTVTLTSSKEIFKSLGLWYDKLDNFWNRRTVEKKLGESKPILFYTGRLQEAMIEMVKERTKQFQRREEIMREVRSMHIRNFASRCALKAKKAASKNYFFHTENHFQQ